MKILRPVIILILISCLSGCATPMLSKDYDPMNCLERSVIFGLLERDENNHIFTMVIRNLRDNTAYSIVKGGSDNPFFAIKVPLGPYAITEIRYSTYGYLYSIKKKFTFTVPSDFCAVNIGDFRREKAGMFDYILASGGNFAEAEKIFKEEYPDLKFYFVREPLVIVKKKDSVSDIIQPHQQLKGLADTYKDNLRKKPAK